MRARIGVDPLGDLAGGIEAQARKVHVTRHERLSPLQEAAGESLRVALRADAVHSFDRLFENALSPAPLESGRP